MVGDQPSAEKIFRQPVKILYERGGRMVKPLETQVFIIGGGVAGTSVARELSRYKVDTTLVERAADVAAGESKSNHGFVYPSIGLLEAFSLVLKSVVLRPGTKLFDKETMIVRWTTEGYNLFELLAGELDLPYINPGCLAIARNDEEVKGLKRLIDICNIMSDDTGRECVPRWLEREEVLAMEPNITADVVCGIYDNRWSKLIYPWDYCIALAESARDNGVRMIFNAEVRGIAPQDGGFIVETSQGPITTEFIVNAAGRGAARIAEMAGVCDFGLIFNRSQMMLLDKHLEGMVNNQVIIPPKPGWFATVMPRPEGNPYVCCGTYSATQRWEAEDTATRREWFIDSVSEGQRIFPGISERDVIASFVGVRVFNTRNPDDHIVEVTKNPRFINMVVRLPGNAFCTAAAKHIVEMLGNQGLQLTKKTDFNPRRKRIPRVDELTYEERDALIARDPRYGHIVCRCEDVTEGEIVEAIRRGATTVQGIQFRTRAGMGRCQRGFCGPRVLEILSRELGIPKTEVTFKGPGSEILLYKSKELLQE